MGSGNPHKKWCLGSELMKAVRGKGYPKNRCVVFFVIFVLWFWMGGSQVYAAAFKVPGGSVIAKKFSRWQKHTHTNTNRQMHITTCRLNRPTS